MAGRLTLAVPLVLLLTGPVGCGRQDWSFGTKAPPQRQLANVPSPIDLMLPKAIRVHPFTGSTFGDDSGVKGIEVRIEAVDSFGDATKAFGDFRFEMFDFVPNSLDPKGKHIATWDESLLEARKNLLHWDKITRTYVFRLQWQRPVPAGRRVVLLVSFSSPFTQRLSAERAFVSGQ